MKEHPILFSAPMVEAILDGRKTQTRRLFMPKVDTDGALQLGDTEQWQPMLVGEMLKPVRCPYGVPGDRLWVKETYYSEKQEQAGTGAVRWVVHLDGSPRIGAFYRATQPLAPTKRWKPAIHMPRCLSRIKLEVTGVRVERLQDITEEDARAEGVEARVCGQDESGPIRSYRTGFVYLWQQINGERANWLSNPWVWVVGFKRLEEVSRAA